jgi:hypothetical protein
VHSEVKVVPRPPRDRGKRAGQILGEKARHLLTATVYRRGLGRDDNPLSTVSWPMIMHRPLPEDCVIKEVVISRLGIEARWR